MVHKKKKSTILSAVLAVLPIVTFKAGAGWVFTVLRKCVPSGISYIRKDNPRKCLLQQVINN
jgi:hypothetical protein